MKKAGKVFLVFAIIFACAFTGCKKKTSNQRIIGYTAMDLTTPFHIAMRDTIKNLVEAQGDIFVGADGKLNQAVQNDAIEDMITQGINVLILNPVDSQSVQPALEACARAHIPVVNVDSSVADTSLIATFISSNNVMAGYQCGEEIVRLYPDGAKICIIENPLAESVVSRVKGLEQAIKDTPSKIIDRKSVASMDVILSTSEDMLQANPNIDVFWALMDDVTLISLGAIESAGRADKIRVFSVDGAPSGKTSVANGGLYATAAQSPKRLAEKAVECADALLSGGSIDKQYTIDTILITPDNIQNFSTTDWD
jgi:ribose transport system substrate-binding protein